MTPAALEWVARFRRYMNSERRLSAHTDSNYARDLAALVKYCDRHGLKDWAALEAILQSAAREDPDDATPYYRAAERLLSDNRDAARAGRYLRIYLAQESEGNQPTAADAKRELQIVNGATTGGVN